MFKELSLGISIFFKNYGKKNTSDKTVSNAALISAYSDFQSYRKKTTVIHVQDQKLLTFFTKLAVSRLGGGLAAAKVTLKKREYILVFPIVYETH